MRTTVYVLLGALVAFYLILLFILNQIPQVSVKKFGWLSLKKITIRLGSQQIRIYKVGVRFNFHKDKNSPFRFFHIEISGLSLVVNGIADKTVKVGEKELKSHSKENDVDPKNPLSHLSFSVPKKLIDNYYFDRISNQIAIHFYKTSIVDQKKHQKYTTDYIRFENKIEKALGQNKFVITSFNGFLQEDTDKDNSVDFDSSIKLYRNIELTLLCDTVVSCKVGQLDKLHFELKNFHLSLSIGKLNVPLDKFRNEDPLIQEGAVDTSSSSASSIDEKSSPSIRENEASPEPKKIISKLSLLQDLLDHFNSVDLKLEDFSVNYKKVKVNISNFSSSLAIKERVPSKKSDFFNFSLNMVDTKVLHMSSPFVEIPSFNNSLDIDARRLLAAIDRVRKDPYTCTKADNLDLSIDNRCMITNPTIDLYYDQIDFLNKGGDKHKDEKPKECSSLWLLLHFFSEVTTKLTVLDLDLNIHIPPKGFVEFRRNSKDNNILTFHLSSFAHKSTSRNFALESGSMKGEAPKLPPKRSIIISQLFKFKHLRANAVDNVIQINKMNLMTCYNVSEENISVRFYIKKIDLKSVNEAIFHMIREIKDWSNTRYNRKYESLQFKKMETKIDNCNVSSDKNNENLIVDLDIFESIPSVISSFKIHITSIEADITCKDGLPSHVFLNEYDEKIDLADFRRGISLKFQNIEFNLKVPKKEIGASIKAIQCFTLSEYDAEYSPEHDMGINEIAADSDFSDVASFDSNVFKGYTSGGAIKSSSNINGPEQRAKKVLHIRDIDVSNKNDAHDANKLFLRIPEIDGRVTMFLVWCSLYAISLGKYFAPTVQKVCTKQQMKEVSEPGGTVTRKLKLDILVDSIASIVRLPNDVDMLLEVDTLRVSNSLDTKSVRFNTARAYVVHPSTKLWTRLIVIKKSQVLLNGDFSSTTIESDGIKLSIPYQFMFYTVIDNVITFFKAIKQIQHNFKDLVNGRESFEKIFPTEKPAIVFPNVKVKTKGFFLTLDNDPFETELGYIFELGKLANKERLKLSNALDKKCEQLRKESLESRIELTEDTPKAKSPLRNEIQLENVNGLDPVLADEVIEAKIKEARDEFNIGVGRGWIQKYKKVRQTKIESKRSQFNRCWNEAPINKTMLSKFDILNYPIGSNLLTMCFLDLDLEFDKVATEIQENLDQFIFEKAKGQPKQKYSILIPMFISLKCKGLYGFLKDYHLPLISFPKHSQEDAEPTFTLKGNVVINETLFKRPEELRHIFVPFSPVLPNENYDDTFYSVFIPRTLTPVKFVVDLECDIDTDRACVLTWCKSYEAGISAAMSALDNFTKPQIDDSPLGWWDKMALLLHGSFKCRVSNELCLHIKGSTDPYDLVGKASGLVFSWKNNVLLTIDGSSGKQDQILMVTSDDFLLAIPNYSVKESSSWSIHQETSYLGNDSPIDFESAEAKKYQKRIMKLSSDAKVKWKVGLLFERNKDINDTLLSSDQERVSEFKPHYDVEVTGPAYKYHPDSYSGFRSDYLHFAIGVESKPIDSSSENCHNALCLTPLTFHYFFHWWDLMTKSVSLPVKQGKLFGITGKDKSHVKMGPHLFTLKYQLILEPLTISHFYMHSSTEDLDKNNKIAFTGLKGKFKSCAIDLHQRKEIVRYVNEKLNINNKVYHLKMNKGEVNIKDSDIRVVSAIFEEKSIRGYLATQMGATSSQSSSHFPSEVSTSSSSGNYDFYGANLFSNDWVDTDDFVELEQRDVLSANPRVQIFPFFSSPAFSYVREFSFTNGGKYPFGSELSHQCVLGRTKPDVVQQNIIQQRISTLSNAIIGNEKLLEKSVDFRQKTRAKKEIKLLHEKLDVVRALQQTLEEEAEEVTQDEDDTSLKSGSSGKSLSRVSTALSLYTSHVEEEDMIHTRILNSDASHYHNRFIIHNMKLQWYNRLRNVFIDYIQRIGDRRSEVYFMSKQAVDLVESIIRDSKTEEDKSDNEDIESKKTGTTVEAEEPLLNSCKNSDDIMTRFEKILSETKGEEEVQRSFLVKLIHPQIQLISSKEKSSCVLVTGRDLELHILSINKPGMNDIISESSAVAGLIESRYGVLFNDQHVYVFNKDDGKKENNHDHDIFMGSTLSEDKSYDPNGNWPPWIDLETFYENRWLEDKLLIERNSIAMLYHKKNPLYTPDDASMEVAEYSGVIPTQKLADTLDLYLSKVVISATPKQYKAVQTVIQDLIIKSKTKRDDSLERLKKVMELTDSSDFEGLDERVISLQRNIREYRDIFLQLESRGIKLSALENQQLENLEIELERMKIELVVLMKGLRLRGKSRSSENAVSKIRSIFADQIILHLLKEGREPFIDLALAKSKYTLHQHIDGANFNKLEIMMIQGFNLQKDSVYPELLRPMNEVTEALSNDSTPIIEVTWKMLKPVGGIGILEKARLAIQPLKIELDYYTVTTLMTMLFPKSEALANIDEKSPKTSNIETTVYDEELDDSDSGSRHSSQFSRDSPNGGGSPIGSKKSHNPFKRFIQKRISSSPSSTTLTSDSDSAASSIMEVQTKDSSDSSSMRSHNEKKSSSGSSSRKSKKTLYTDDKDDIALIIERASKYLSVVDVEITKADLMISFKAPKHLNIIDVHKLKITLPTLNYRYKIWSAEDAMIRLRKDIIKIVLAHSGKILGNKFKNRNRTTSAQPLKQIDDYNTFMSVKDLQSDGRSRDSNKSPPVHIRPHLPHAHHTSHTSKERVSRRTSENIDQYLTSIDSNENDDTEEGADREVEDDEDDEDDEDTELNEESDIESDSPEAK
ncbi:uncharacterized protein CLIB1423_10S01596 [[Candida] railenensis]|uniref:Uncharacterized protein n=1 Tax=[Candida] railenensis TaxID=45579 RepID=A0A9P0VZ91_9ASCO|nr:uncharacterized protein CLIB1423_10S01596 [[Candida] railenensis]